MLLCVASFVITSTSFPIFSRTPCQRDWSTKRSQHEKNLTKKTIYYIPIAIAFLALLSGCDEEGSSDDVNLSLALQDKGITWFSSETYGSGEWIQTTLKYDDLLFYSSETTHNKYTQSAAGDFQLEPQSTKNFVLTSSAGYKVT